MELKPGTRLGPYEIGASLGAGGMGEVYRARDTRLNREVAIKVMRASFSRDPERLRRFEQEARTVAALNHPNLMAVYDVGEVEGSPYLVSELLEGETLRSLLQQGSVPVRTAIDFGIQIAQGLAAAHEKNIVHRDLKPENLFVTGDNRIKILDFGLAKLLQQNAGDELATMGRSTSPGVVLGTVGYMAPEQVRGQAVDARADIFALGAILYEMVAGRRAFQGESSVETMNAVLKEEPPELSSSALPVSPALDTIIRRCLQKKPQNRFHAVSDVGFALEAAAGRSSASAATPAAITTETTRVAAGRRLAWSAGMMAFGLATAGLAAWWAGRDAPENQSRFRFTPFSSESGGNYESVWSPDGHAVAYAASTDATHAGQLFVRYLDQPVAQQLTHWPEAVIPAGWRPSGDQILFFSNHKPSGLWSVAAVGAEPQPVASIDFDLRSANSVMASVSPAGDAVALVKAGPDGRTGVGIVSPLGAPMRMYSPAPFATHSVFNVPHVKFAPDGKKILLLLNGEWQKEEAWLLPYPPDPAHPPRQVLPEISQFGATPDFAWMPDSRHIVMNRVEREGDAPQLWVADTESNRTQALTSGTVSHSLPSVAPDGTRLIYRESFGNWSMVSVQLADAKVERVPNNARDVQMPAWAAQRSVLVYVTDRNGPTQIWVHEPDRADRPVVTAHDFPNSHIEWFVGPTPSPSGDRVIYSMVGDKTEFLWMSSLSGGAPIRVTGQSGDAEFTGSWSPDGSTFLYLLLRQGKMMLAKVKTSGSATPEIVNADVDAVVPMWSPRGDRFVYMGSDDNTVISSADGKRVHKLGTWGVEAWTFSADGSLLYGIRSDRGALVLFSVNADTGADHAIGEIGADLSPTSNLNPTLRLSLAPDGKSIAYTALTGSSSLWMMEGFEPGGNWIDRLLRR